MNDNHEIFVLSFLRQGDRRRIFSSGTKDSKKIFKQDEQRQKDLISGKF